MGIQIKDRENTNNAPAGDTWMATQNDGEVGMKSPLSKLPVSEATAAAIAAASGVVEVTDLVVDGANAAIAVNMRSNMRRMANAGTIVAWRLLSHTDGNRTAAQAASSNVILKIQKSSYADPYSVSDVGTLTLSAGNSKAEAVGTLGVLAVGDLMFATVTAADGSVGLLDITLEIQRP